ncbi:MAG: Flp pilus assembly protein CpaB [Rhodobacteraceae bacterium]|nr:MAG: Flp pilus assembly protein CpaB [Paracoccaceae bacterium]
MPVLRFLILAVAIAAGGFAAWLAVMREPSVEIVEVAAPVDALPQVLVAVRPLGLGVVAQEADFAWRDWPEHAVSPAFIRREAQPNAIAAFADQIVRSAMVAGEPIIPEKLSDQRAGFMASMLDSGKRAVAVRVTAESAVAGFVLPGDRVDLVHTFRRDSGGARSITLLTNIKVLAIDQRAGETRDGALLGKTATLELDPGQVERVVAAERSGALSLALRSAADFREEPGEPPAGVEAGVDAVMAAMPAAEVAGAGQPSPRAASTPGKPVEAADVEKAAAGPTSVRVRRGLAPIETVTLN